jgi:hypothetical protein
MNRQHRVATFVMALAVSVIRPAALQAADPPDIDLAGGFAFTHFPNFSNDDLTGWFGSIDSNVTPRFGIVGDVSGGYRTDSLQISNAHGVAVSVDGRRRAYTFMAGPRINSSGRTAQIFGQMLVGGEILSGRATLTTPGLPSTSESTRNTWFAIAPGGGIDVKASAVVGFRFGANVRLIDIAGGWVKQVQVVAGMVWSLK